MIVDSMRAMVLWETRHLPTFYFRCSDFCMDLLHLTDHITHCPFKGNASYWNIAVGDTVVENAAWSYETPFVATTALTDYVALTKTAWMRGLRTASKSSLVKMPFHWCGKIRLSIGSCGRLGRRVFSQVDPSARPMSAARLHFC